MREIPLTQNQVALVDDCDYERLNQFKWYALKSRNTFYAERMSPTVNGKRYMVHMHHEITGIPPKGLMTDHKNGVGTDNRRKNLRFVTNRQNLQNRKNKRWKSSKYPGVSWDKTVNKWHTQIQINGKRKTMGVFINEKEAFEVYKQAVNKIGENVIDEQ